MKTRKSLLIPISLVAALVIAGLACQPPAVGAEGLNAAYARLANSVVPSIERIAGRYFNGTVEIKGVPQSEMRAVLADDMRLARAEQLSEPELARRSGALSEAIPIYYSIARHRIYFSADTVRQKLKDGRLNPAWENDALRLMLAHELVRFLDDQQADLKKLLGSDGSAARVRTYRAMTAGHARMVTEIIATQWDRPGVGEIVSRWSLGEGAWQGLEKSTGAAMDEEFSFCFDGGYRFASYLYDNFGADGFYRSYTMPPASASVLFNPAEYKFEKTADTPASPGGGVAAGQSGGPKGDILVALKETGQFLPPGEWMNQVSTRDELLKNVPAGQRQLVEESIVDWQAIMFLDTQNIRIVVMSVIRVKGNNIDTNTLKSTMLGMEQGMASTGGVSPDFEPPIQLSGIAGGTGWLQRGRMSDASGSASIAAWMAACNAGDYIVYGTGINCTIDEGQASALLSAILGKLL